MLPTKRSSPFARTRSFQDRNAKDGTDANGPPFAKRPFTRTMSSPFQVVTTSLKGTKNPFEKLAVAPSKPASNSLSTDYAALHIDEDQTDDLQDESMDPNRTLQMFSFSQNSAATTIIATKEPSLESGDDDEDNTDQLQDNLTEDTHDTSLKPETNSPGLRRPRLQEALEMSLSSISITSSDSLTWCDHISPTDEIDALQHFISSQKTFSSPQNEPRLDLGLSPKTRVLSATYHWIYPTNTPSVHQAQNISKLLKNASNMSSSDKTAITELFSRSAEWKQSFRAIYQSFRNGACPYFYYVGTSWTILFQHGSVSLSGESEALLTNSTPGLWKALKDEDINYEQLENLGGKVAVTHFSSKHDLDHLEDQDQDETQPATTDALTYPFYLLMLTMKLQISKCKMVSRPVQGTDKMQKEYRIEIHGIVLPNSVKDLYQTFAAQQRPGGYSCISTSDARSHGLNLRPLHSETADTDMETSTRLAGIFASAKSLDQFRYDYTLQQYIWLS
ncbi:hypothetical protein BG015_001604 [Linnemannia schmuckeri]|uniref:Uncharacterized protein n=1 Tax=Linnemannia schmuckeri TaxID=64567 RepID=A0A9P5RSZ6_9FUNG|nr:hypothetical protein BG015_001604 [Linnemannia schmuckeri]